MDHEMTSEQGPVVEQQYQQSGLPSADQTMGGFDQQQQQQQQHQLPLQHQHQHSQQQYQQQQQQPSTMMASGVYAQDEEYRRPQTSKSADFAISSSGFDDRYPSPNMSQQTLVNQQSRPPSSLSQTTTGQNGYDRQSDQGKTNNSVVIKVGMVGDAQIGKTSLMVKYVEGNYDEDYIQTLGVNFMEKTISIRNTEITFSIWDLGGQREFVNMLPLVCNDAVAILFMFDLTRKSTLNSIKEWYRQGRGFNKTAIPFLVGTKYDHFVNMSQKDQEEISAQAKRFAKAMRASLIFSSTSHSINVQKIFKIVLSKAFDLKCTIPEIENVGEPLLMYQHIA